MATLTPDRIVDEALLMIDASGEAALSMRRLAAKFDVTPMALYRYFPDRDALLLAVVERVSQRIDFPEPATGPADRAVDLALCLHDFLVAYPWLIRLITTGRLASPAGMRFPEGFLGCARDTGLDDQSAFTFYRTIFAAILGQATITSATREHAFTAAPNHASDPALPLVNQFSRRWQDLQGSATPKRIFEAIAALLPPPHPESPPQPHRSIPPSTPERDPHDTHAPHP